MSRKPPVSLVNHDPQPIPLHEPTEASVVTRMTRRPLSAIAKLRRDKIEEIYWGTRERHLISSARWFNLDRACRMIRASHGKWYREVYAIFRASSLWNAKSYAVMAHLTVAGRLLDGNPHRDLYIVRRARRRDIKKGT